MGGWWACKIHRTWRYLRPAVTGDERAGLAELLSPGELALFERMHAADRRHGLDVMAALRAGGVTDRDLLVAAVIHDCGKGRKVRLVHRVAWSLCRHYGEWICRVARRLPSFRNGLETLRRHAERSAELAEEAGCSPRIVELIRLQENPADEAGELLRAADEAN